MNSYKTIQRWLLGALTSLFVAPLHADVSSLIRKLTMDRLELEVQVSNETGQPLAGAVIWYIGLPVRPESGMLVNLAAAKRMAQRYARQSDFLETNDLSGAVFERTDIEGRYRDFREARYPDKRYPYIIVVTKRGYVPEVIEGVAPLNERHVVKLQLKPDVLWKVSPRMEEFDRLMALARTIPAGEEAISETRMRKLRELYQQVRVLAQSLEEAGLQDDASAIFWALADFPEVTAIDLLNSTQQVVGYRNGRNDAQAEADRLRATMLNTSVPKLLIGKELVTQGFKRVGISDSVKGRAYLLSFERMAGGQYGEQLLPRDYRTAIWQALDWGTPDQACALLQRAYRFEPTTMPLKDWWAMVRRIEDRRKELKLPSLSCTVEGLAPFEH